MRCILFWFGLMCLVIGSSVLLGGYMPNQMYVNRVKPVSCDIFYTYNSYLCREGTATRTCYSILCNIKANKDCWRSEVVLVVHKESLAKEIIQNNPPYDWPCYFDPQNVCYPSLWLPDIEGTFWAGIIFTGLAFAFFVWLIVCQIYKTCRRGGYTEIKDIQL